MNAPTAVVRPFYDVQTISLYTLLLCLQVFDLVNFMILTELVGQGLVAIPTGLLMGIQFSVVLILNVIMTVFVNRFIKRKVWVYLYVAAVVLSLVFAFGTAGPLGYLLDANQVKVISVLGFGFAGLSNTFIAMLALRDVFSKKHELSYSLIGASWIFLLISIVFANIYMFLEAFSPGMIMAGENVNVVITCLRYSIYVIAGQDPPFENVHVLIRNISTFESIFSNLYGVMVVGRLLTK